MIRSALLLCAGLAAALPTVPDKELSLLAGKDIALANGATTRTKRSHERRGNDDKVHHPKKKPFCKDCEIDVKPSMGESSKLYAQVWAWWEVNREKIIEKELEADKKIHEEFESRLAKEHEKKKEAEEYEKKKKAEEYEKKQE